jgi:hypothetical protein
MSGTTISAAQSRDLVREAVGVEWETFAARHPKLAGVLDREMIVRAAGTELAEDPEYRRAMDEATAAGMGAAVMAEVVRSFVKDWLARLF